MVLGKSLILDLLSIFFTIISNLLRDEVPVYCALVISPRSLNPRNLRNYIRLGSMGTRLGLGLGLGFELRVRIA